MISSYSNNLATRNFDTHHTMASFSLPANSHISANSFFSLPAILRRAFWSTSALPGGGLGDIPGRVRCGKPPFGETNPSG